MSAHHLYEPICNHPKLELVQLFPVNRGKYGRFGFHWSPTQDVKFLGTTKNYIFLKNHQETNRLPCSHNSLHAAKRISSMVPGLFSLANRIGALVTWSAGIGSFPKKSKHSTEWISDGTVYGWPADPKTNGIIPWTNVLSSPEFWMQLLSSKAQFMAYTAY